MYFCVQNGPIIDATTTPPTRLYTLYRRVLLVSPGLLNTRNVSRRGATTTMNSTTSRSARS